MAALLLVLVLIFICESIVRNPVHILMVAVPIGLQSYLIAGLAFFSAGVSEYYSM
jgi:ACR3 family arsenite efflux pump ArsB